jgi:hypothetical protein
MTIDTGSRYKTHLIWSDESSSRKQLNVVQILQNQARTFSVQRIAKQAAYHGPQDQRARRAACENVAQASNSIHTRGRALKARGDRRINSTFDGESVYQIHFLSPYEPPEPLD